MLYLYVNISFMNFSVVFFIKKKKINNLVTIGQWFPIRSIQTVTAIVDLSGGR